MTLMILALKTLLMVRLGFHHSLIYCMCASLFHCPLLSLSFSFKTMYLFLSLPAPIPLSWPLL